MRWFRKKRNGIERPEPDGPCPTSREEPPLRAEVEDVVDRIRELFPEAKGLGNAMHLFMVKGTRPSMEAFKYLSAFAQHQTERAIANGILENARQAEHERTESFAFGHGSTTPPPGGSTALPPATWTSLRHVSPTGGQDAMDKAFLGYCAEAIEATKRVEASFSGLSRFEIAQRFIRERGQLDSVDYGQLRKRVVNQRHEIKRLLRLDLQLRAERDRARDKLRNLQTGYDLVVQKLNAANEEVQRLENLADFRDERCTCSPVKDLVSGARDEVKWFSGEMERELRANDAKPGWADECFAYLHEHLQSATVDVYHAVESSGPAYDQWAVLKECANVANYAMMIADNATRDARAPKERLIMTTAWSSKRKPEVGELVLDLRTDQHIGYVKSVMEDQQYKNMWQLGLVAKDDSTYEALRVAIVAGCQFTLHKKGFTPPTAPADPGPAHFDEPDDLEMFCIDTDDHIREGLTPPAEYISGIASNEAIVGVLGCSCGKEAFVLQRVGNDVFPFQVRCVHCGKCTEWMGTTKAAMETWAKIVGMGAAGVRPVMPQSVRPELRWFVVEMEKKLKANDHKGGWDNMSANELRSRLEDELQELTLVLDKPAHLYTPQQAVDEAADVANFAMMVAYQCMSPLWTAQKRAKEENVDD